MKITLGDYLGRWCDCEDATPERKTNAAYMLSCVNRLLARAVDDGVELKNNPATGSLVSGETYGGFRPQSCTQGAPHSSHKDGMAVDIYDPRNALDDYLTDALLEEFGLYREHPDSTKSWCHLSTRSPRSGRRTFFP